MAQGFALWIASALALALAGCGAGGSLPVYEASTPPREWAADFRVEEAFCDGEDLAHRLLPCAGDLESLTVVQQGPERVCLRPRGAAGAAAWICLDQSLALPSSDEVSLNRSEDGFVYVRQSPLMRPGVSTRVRLTFRRLPDKRWILIEDAQEGRLPFSARRQILYLILSR